MPETNTATTTAPSRRRDRQPAKRPEQIAAEASLAAATAEAKPAFQLNDEQRARIEKERAKLEKEEAAAARRKARLEALERGEDPPIATKGLPTVVGMNKLGLTARELHRASLLFVSDAVKSLDAEEGVAARATASVAANLRDKAIAQWSEQHQRRVDAGVADNDTLAPLGLTRNDEGEWVLIEKKGAKATE